MEPEGSLPCSQEPATCAVYHFVTCLLFYVGELLADHPVPKLEGHCLSAARDCLFSIFAVTLHIWRHSPPSATRGHAMPWWQGTHLTWACFQYLAIICVPSTVLGANLCARDPIQVKCKGIRGAGGVADKEAYTVHTINIISQRQYIVARCLISVGNVFGLHNICVCFPSARKLVT
jgi:hypothetical protein